MKLTVGQYVKEEDAYRCKDEHGKTHFVDFHISGSPEIKKYEDREKLVGKVVEIEWLHPWLELSSDVLSVETPTPKL